MQFVCACLGNASLPPSDAPLPGLVEDDVPVLRDMLVIVLREILGDIPGCLNVVEFAR